jgi:hypothetical protein
MLDVNWFYYLFSAGEKHAPWSEESGAISNKWILIRQKAEDIKWKSTKEILSLPLDLPKSILK